MSLTQRRWGRLLIVLVGVVAGQAMLFGPSLLGTKILLPLDLLAVEGTYLPRTPDVRKIQPHNLILQDLILTIEIERRFTAAELHAGRLPLWTTYQYLGSPLVFPKFSPFVLLSCITESPVILAWVQLAQAIVACIGAYLFFRRALGVGFWSAAIPAWCFPITGFLVFFQGFPSGVPVVWLPWAMLAVDRTIRKGGWLASAGSGVATCLVLISGNVDIAGQVLLVCGLYALWCLWDAHRAANERPSQVSVSSPLEQKRSLDLRTSRGWSGSQWDRRTVLAAVARLTLGWTLGFLLAAPYLLPLLEYTKTSARMERRAAGTEVRPPGGIAALPEIVLPDIYGADHAGSFRIKPVNQFESAAAIYAGVLTTLVLAPLAWCSRRHRSFTVFALLLSLVAVSWCLNVPGLVWLWRRPGLSMLSHNRLVFAATFAILAMAAIGLNAMLRGEVSRRPWFWLPVSVLAVTATWCFLAAWSLPEPIASRIGAGTGTGTAIKAWYARSYLVAGALCTVGILGWLGLRAGGPWPRRLVPIFALVALADLLSFALPRRPQCDPALYYPRIPALQEIAKATPGRVVGFGVFPATLAQTHGLQDVRGYDGLDPGRLVDILLPAAHAESVQYEYARTQWFTPRVEDAGPGQVRLPPILDMLGVRYLIARGVVPPGTQPRFRSEDYWVMENTSALPRVFVPRQVATVTDDRDRLAKLASPTFDPREVAYVEEPVRLPVRCSGTAQIVSEVPTRVTVAVQMSTPGLVVLSDLWDVGWTATLNGKPVPILRTNHAVRGVIVPVGEGTIEFRYLPRSLVGGLWLSGLGAVMMGGMLVSSLSAFRRRAE